MAEIMTAWDSLKHVLNEVIPLLFVSALASIVDFLQRHFGVEPFSCARFLVGFITDLIYGTLVGLTARGFGAHRFIAWGIAGMAVHIGLRRVERYATEYFEKKYNLTGRQAAQESKKDEQ